MLLDARRYVTRVPGHLLSMCSAARTAGGRRSTATTTTGRPTNGPQRHLIRAHWAIIGPAAQEIAYHDFAAVEPQDTEGLWAGNAYNGFVYTNGLFRGFDTLFIPKARPGGKQLATLIPHTPVRRRTGRAPPPDALDKSCVSRPGIAVAA